MASFYRKWRPQKFEDVVGQEHIKKTLINALKSRKVAHAYLFAGPRGTGKTTMARLLAKTINCEKFDYKHPAKDKKEYEPCNECASCKEITAGQSLDVIEIDAASNRGIEEIRELREKVRFAPVRAAFKVFIIDEVHMLTREAFNALLKTLEEPPAHAIFILATTEVHKVLPTIVSRCQRYDFHRGQISEVKLKLNEVAKAENLKIDNAGVEMLARMSDGSFRDALSLLDQVASVYDGKKELGVNEIRLVLGLSDSESIKKFLKLLAAGEVEKVVGLLAEIVDNGGDMSFFVNQLISEVRRMVLIKSGVSHEVAAPEWTDEEYVGWVQISLGFTADQLLDLLNELILAVGEIKRSPLAQLPVEMLVIGWMQKFGKLKEEGKKVSLLIEEAVVPDEPKKVQDLIKVESDSSNSGSVGKVDGVTGGEEKKPEGQKAKATDSDQQVWETVIEKVKPINHSLYTILMDASLKSFEIDKVVIGVRFRFHSERIHDRKNKQIVETALEEVCGKSLRLECLIDEKLPKPKSVQEQDVLNTAVEVFGMES